MKNQTAYERILVFLFSLFLTTVGIVRAVDIMKPTSEQRIVAITLGWVLWPIITGLGLFQFWDFILRKTSPIENRLRKASVEAQESHALRVKITRAVNGIPAGAPNPRVKPKKGQMTAVLTHASFSLLMVSLFLVLRPLSYVVICGLTPYLVYSRLL